jgi:hypothetical protein
MGWLLGGYILEVVPRKNGMERFWGLVVVFWGFVEGCRATVPFLKLCNWLVIRGIYIISRATQKWNGTIFGGKQVFSALSFKFNFEKIYTQ